MKRLQLVIIIVFVILSTCGNAQYSCKVLIENLQGQYNGECKKGLADGEGAAKGVDTYIGSFKKGFPHGYGVYTFANGSSYIGNFRSGKKDGYGLLKMIVGSGDIVQNYGLWLADSLVVANDSKALFHVKEKKGIKVIDPKITKDVSVKSQIWINFMVDGVPDKSVLIKDVEISNGVRINTEERSLNTLVAFDGIKEFPVTFKLTYQIRKTDQLFLVDCVAEITLLTNGLWEINLNH